MTPCERLSDRMPAAAGGEPWTAEETAHLAACADCAAEWALVAGVRTLGVGAGAALNAHHVTERVLGRLRAERAATRARRRGFALAGLAAAAALALAVWSGGAPSAPASAAGVAAADLSLAELDSLRAPELEALLRSLELADETGIDAVPAVPSLLEDSELDGVLEALEG